MKATRKNSGQVNSRLPDSTRHVRFEYVNPVARSVCLAGTFNDWHPKVTEMLRVGDGWWVKELALAPGSYEYRLVVDGQWLADPNCQASVPNPHGGRNSLLTVLPKPSEEPGNKTSTPFSL